MSEYQHRQVECKKCHATGMARCGKERILYVDIATTPRGRHTCGGLFKFHRPERKSEPRDSA